MKNVSKYDYNFGLKAIRKASKHFPGGSGVYTFLDSKKKVLYVGKAKNLKKRISSYLNVSNQTNRIKLLINLTSEIKFIKTLTEIDSFILENNLIKQNKPKFNVRLIDDKSYPYINISISDTWPRIRKFRGKRNKSSYVTLIASKLSDIYQISIEEIDVIASTVAPGLVGCLRVGSITARTLCTLYSKPFLGIHHF